MMNAGMTQIREDNQETQGSNSMQPMNNARLAKRSETFDDDNGVRVDKRCFFLAVGDDD